MRVCLFPGLSGIDLENILTGIIHFDAMKRYRSTEDEGDDVVFKRAFAKVRDIDTYLPVNLILSYTTGD